MAGEQVPAAHDGQAPEAQRVGLKASRGAAGLVDPERARQAARAGREDFRRVHRKNRAPGWAARTSALASSRVAARR